MSGIPPTEPGLDYGRHFRPHRGGVVLALGILGLVVCPICGIVAWVMGNNDLRDMEAGTMDPDGESLTNAGRICGMISVLLAAIGLGIGILMLGCLALTGVASM